VVKWVNARNGGWVKNEFYVGRKTDQILRGGEEKRRDVKQIRNGQEISFARSQSTRWTRRAHHPPRHHGAERGGGG
jgi:hypothetical protein